MTKKTKCNTISAVMTKINVYDEGVLIGYGWLYHTEYGMTTPELFRLDGSILEHGWYRITPVEDRMVVMCATVQ